MSQTIRREKGQNVCDSEGRQKCVGASVTLINTTTFLLFNSPLTGSYNVNGRYPREDNGEMMDLRPWVHFPAAECPDVIVLGLVNARGKQTTILDTVAAVVEQGCCCVTNDVILSSHLSGNSLE